jgi:hypothetical protein
MLRRALLILALLIASPALATTTVTGTLQNLGGGTVGQGAFVRFWLRGCAGNQPRVNGTALIAPTQGGVFFFDLIANSSGVISGTIYSTRDSTGLLGGDIECGGSKTAVWYGMQTFVSGKGGPEIPVHAKNTGTLDISSVTPITTTPVVTAPTGDSTYFRLDAGNSPITGLTTFSAGLKTAAGTGIGINNSGANNGQYNMMPNDCIAVTGVCGGVWTSTGMSMASGKGLGVGGASPVANGLNFATSGALYQSGTGIAQINSGSIELLAGKNLLLDSGSNLTLANALVVNTAPTISSGFGTSPSVTSSNGTAAFTVNVGGGGAATGGVIGMPTANIGWLCSVNNMTAAGANRADNTRQTNFTTTSVTVQNQTTSTGAAVAWTANDLIRLNCFAF